MSWSSQGLSSTSHTFIHLNPSCLCSITETRLHLLISTKISPLISLDLAFVSFLLHFIFHVLLQIEIYSVLAYGFPVAVITNYRKFSGLKEQKDFLPQSSKLEPEIWIEMKMSGGLHFLQRLQGRIHSLPLPTSGGCQHSLINGHISPFCASVVASPPPLLCLPNIPLPLFYKDNCDCI